MLTRITSPAAGVGPAQDCPASSHSVPLPRFSHGSCESRDGRREQPACSKLTNLSHISFPGIKSSGSSVLMLRSIIRLSALILLSK